MVLDHEAQHQRLHSHDESRVNACALADMPRLPQTDYHVPATLTQTVNEPQQYQVNVRKHVKAHRRWCGRRVWSPAPATSRRSRRTRTRRTRGFSPRRRCFVPTSRPVQRENVLMTAVSPVA